MAVMLVLVVLFWTIRRHFVAVERRLAHVRRKLGIGAADAYGGSAAGLEVRDAARVLADLVLRTGAVTADDLAWLEGASDGVDREGAP